MSKATTVWEVFADRAAYDEAEWCLGRYIRVRRMYFYYWGA
jgi:hypothetical protein